MLFGTKGSNQRVALTSLNIKQIKVHETEFHFKLECCYDILRLASTVNIEHQCSIY